MEWWDNHPELRPVLNEHYYNCEKTLTRTMKDFLAWLKSVRGEEDEIILWSLGSDFDIAILNHLLDTLDLQPEWKYWNTRCLRTFGALYPHIKRPKANDHNALADARNEMEWLKLLLAEHEGRIPK